MWFMMILFMIIGGMAVLFRSPKTLLLLAVVFSFVAILYTPWWPFIFFLLSGVALVVHLDRKDTRKEDELRLRREINEELQEEVEIESLLQNMRKYE